MTGYPARVVDELAVDELAVDELAVDKLAIDELAIDELVCAAAASGDRAAVIKVLTEHLATMTGVSCVCLWRTVGDSTEVLAGQPLGAPAGSLDVVQAAAMTVTLRGPGRLTAGQRQDVAQLLHWAAAALRLTDIAADAVREAATLQTAAAQILQVRDVEQVLLSINECALGLLQADICGIFLRQGDELVMRGCVGNHMVQTSRLRMRRGQGLAGLVFSQGQPGRVDNYLTDQQISPDFMSLAESEQTLSALAVPMRAHGDLIGVLEVWRRRASVFVDEDVRRLEALANLATIAIDNARLHAAHERSVAELSSAHQVLRGSCSCWATPRPCSERCWTPCWPGPAIPASPRPCTPSSATPS
jgi:GAF domain-containing protein